MPITNVRLVTSLQFKDGSIYSGQVLDPPAPAPPLPHGYGLLTTPTSFSHRGLFSQGKALGQGVFRAPNGDAYWGVWGAGNKREGKGLFVRGDGLQLVEEYSGGKMVKRVKRRAPTGPHWRMREGLVFKGEGPCARVGHTCSVTEDESMLIVFGGEAIVNDISCQLNDLHILDLTTRAWGAPAQTGTAPPPMHGHTATIVGGRLIVIGGAMQGLESNSSVFSLDLSTGVWSTLLSHALPFSGHTSTYVPSLHAILTLQHDKVFSFSLTTHTWQTCDDDRRPLMRTPRSFTCHSAVLVGEEVWVIGGKVMGGVVQGMGKAYEKCTGDVRALHTRTMTWRVVELRGKGIGPRCHCMVGVGGGKVWVHGGYSTCNPQLNVVDEAWEAGVFILDVARGEWEEMGGLGGVVPRAEGTMVRVGGEMWVFGGRNAGEQVMKEWNVLDMGVGGGVRVTGGSEAREECKERISEATGVFNAMGADDGVGSGSVLDAFRAQQQGGGQ